MACTMHAGDAVAIKIGYLFRNCPHYLERIPVDVQAVVCVSDGKGGYRREDLERLAGVNGLIVAGSEPVNEGLLAACPGVKIVQKTGVGYENFDLEATRRRGIPCCNLPGVNKVAVAEHALLLMLALGKRLLEADALTRQAKWAEARALYPAMIELQEKTLGIVGLGDIGREVALRARAFGMRIVYHNRTQLDAQIEQAFTARYLQLDELLGASDIVSLHVPISASTRGLIGARALALMKPAARLVCMARGGVLDEPALRAALDAGRLAGAAVDVFSAEPIRPDNPLLGARNIILTAHMGASPADTATREMAWSHENLRRVVERGEKPRWVVNGVE